MYDARSFSRGELIMTRSGPARLTDKLVRSLTPPEKGNQISYDADLPGFGIRLTAAGSRSFILNYVVAGRERRMTIGRFPTWSASAAREEARALKRKINIGVDPLKDRSADRSAAMEAQDAPTLRDLFERYDMEHLPHKAPRSAADDRSMWRNIILPKLSRAKVAAVTPSDVDALHAEISETRPVRANRVIEVLRKAFNLSIRWGWRADNPASGARRNPEEKRDRYLSPAEIIRLGDALAAHPERNSADAIRFLMLTGARRSEALRASWDQFDLDAGVWTKPSSHTKQRKEHRVPLSAPAVGLLREVRARSPGVYVFPASSEDKPLTDIKRSWTSVCREAGLAEEQPQRRRDGSPVLNKNGEPVMVWRPTVRLHDLRHTYASVLASAGFSLPIIGALLGHTQAQTTARYAHLLDNPLRAATEQAADVLAHTSRQMPNEAIVEDV